MRDIEYGICVAFAAKLYVISYMIGLLHRKSNISSRV